MAGEGTGVGDCAGDGEERGPEGRVAADGSAGGEDGLRA